MPCSSAWRPVPPVLLAPAASAVPAATVTPAPGAGTDADDPAADTTVTWGVRPADGEPHGPGRASFAYTAAPGGTLEDALVVSNHGAAETTLQVYAADAFTTTPGGAGPAAPGPGVHRRRGVGRRRAPEVVVPPGQSVTVPFTLRVPDDAEPGDHAGGVVTSLVSERADGVSVDRRLGARLHLRVDGPRAPGAALERLRVVHHGTPDPTATGSADVDVEVVNTGNLRLQGPATVTVTGPFGWGEQVARVDVPELLPGERTTVVVPVEGVRPAAAAHGDRAPRARGGSTVRPSRRSRRARPRSPCRGPCWQPSSSWSSPRGSGGGAPAGARRRRTGSSPRRSPLPARGAGRTRALTRPSRPQVSRAARTA